MVSQATTHGEVMRTPILMFIAVLVGGCSSAWEPEGPPSIQGRIIARDVAISIGNPPTIHVRTGADDQCGVVFLVNDFTAIAKVTPGRGREPGRLSDLTVGSVVSVWSDVMLDSCPGQSSADAIEVVGVNETLRTSR
jgi:hypothetical protein